MSVGEILGYRWCFKLWDWMKSLKKWGERATRVEITELGGKIKVEQTTWDLGNLGTFLVVQWLRICLPVQGTQIWSLLQEDPTCHRATNFGGNYARVPQLVKPTCPRPMSTARDASAVRRPRTAARGLPPLTTAGESPQAAMRTQCSQKWTNKYTT